MPSRDGGGSYNLVFSFTTNVVSGNASVSRHRNRWDTNLSGMTMRLPLTNVADVQTLTVTLTGVTDASRSAAADLVSASMHIGDQRRQDSLIAPMRQRARSEGGDKHKLPPNIVRIAANHFR